MSDAATNVRVPFVPQSGHDESDASSAVLPSTDAAVPVVRPSGPTAGAVSEPVSGEWEEPALPEVDDHDAAAAVPTVDEAAPVIVPADDRPTAEQPAIVDDGDETPGRGAATGPGEAEGGAAADVADGAPKPGNAPPIPQAAKPVPAPAPSQWQGGRNGFGPGAPQVGQGAHGQFHQGPFSGAAQAGPFPPAQASGPIQRPAAPQPFGQVSAPMAPQPQQQAAMRPMGDSAGAPMSTASSSFNQQIRFSDAAVRVSGWRAWLRKMGLDVGPSANDQEHAELVHRIRVPKNKFHVTSVFADNAGGTLLVGVLGQILERTRADNVVALDLDPDGGDLDQVTAWHQGGSTARTLIQQSDLSDRNQVDKHLAVTSTNLHVLPTPWRFNGRDVTDYDDVLDLYSIFRPHYSLALVDAGRGLQTPTGTGVLEISSALILPASATTRGVRRAAATIDWLRHHGWHGLLANTIVVINHTKRHGSVSVEQFDELFRAGQKLRVHEIPYDPHLDSDQPIDVDLLRKRTVRAFEELAADLADGFNSGYEPPAAQKLAELQQARAGEGR